MANSFEGAPGPSPRYALHQFAASFKSWGEIVLMVFGPLLAGVFALIALPPMYAASLPFAQSIALLVAHALAMSVSIWLLRKRVLPHDVLVSPSA
jgi:hypothetical protein